MSRSSRTQFAERVRMRNAARGPLLVALVSVAACADREQSAARLEARALPSPTAAAASRLPRFASGSSAAPLLTWVEERDSEGSERVAELRSARWNGSQWSGAQLVASGADWFVNWADFPALSVLDERRQLAHWLQRSAEGRYDYSVQLARSVDGGATWSAPERLHSHDGPGEHGFVSLVPLAERGWRAVWLDGRRMGEGGHDAHAEHSGAMALYTREVAADGALGEELELDERVCDCCPTAALRSADGAGWIAYRDRDETEVRDIALLRLEPGREPERVWTSGDAWKIAGCPVNGPALAAADERLAIAWFSMGSANSAAVHVAVSNDRGRTFAQRAQLAGSEAIGRVDAVFDARGALIVSWLEQSGESALWRVVRLDDELESPGAQTIAPASAGRDSGIGRLIASGEGVLFAFTEVADGKLRVAVRSLEWR